MFNASVRHSVLMKLHMNIKYAAEISRVLMAFS